MPFVDVLGGSTGRKYEESGRVREVPPRARCPRVMNSGGNFLTFVSTGVRNRAREPYGEEKEYPR